MLLKYANEDSGVAQESQSVEGRRLGFLIPLDGHYPYVRDLSRSKTLHLLLRSDHVHVDMDHSLGMDAEHKANLADASNNHIGGTLARSFRTLYCRPHGGDALLVFSLH